ncbi:MAG: DUF2254 family protein [Acidobacteriaceae bacterium]
MDHSAGHDRPWFSGISEAMAEAFSEFLTIPTCIIIGFLALSIGSYLLDRAAPQWLAVLRNLLLAHVFADPQATNSLLSIIAAGLITVTSITISLLLLALQQSAANFTAQILDQYMRRRINQAYFGFFVGLALYSLVTLATINKPFNPVFGAALAFLLTVAALYLLIVLLYTTINQMRPAQIMEAIHDHVLAARECQLDLIGKTRRAPISNSPPSLQIKAQEEGFVTKIDVDRISGTAQRLFPGAEVTLVVSIGSYVAFQDVIATATEVAGAHTGDDAAGFIKTVQAAVTLERQRDITADAAYGIEQLAMIGWTSISSAKSNLAAGLLALHALRDILARWSLENQPEEKKEEQISPVLAVVYSDDTFGQLLDAFESLAVISSESMQYQVFAEVLRTFAIMYPRLPGQHRPRVEDLLLRILPALGDHVLTRDLDSALDALLRTMTSCSRLKTAALVEKAHRQLQQSVGKLGSRSTRVASDDAG